MIRFDRFFLDCIDLHARGLVPDTIIQVLLEVSSESVAVGDRAWFDCIVTGDPSATITWTKEGSDELPDNAQVFHERRLSSRARTNNNSRLLPLPE